ncbi:MAG: ATP-binding protein, partial [Methylococcales bacterium]
MRARLVESFRLSEVVDEALALTRGRVEGYAKATVLVERSRAREIFVETDRALLLVVLINVLVNAAQAKQEAREPPRNRQGQLIRPPRPAPADGDKIKILVDSEPEDETVVLLLANTGPQVAPEHRERIFTRGFTTRLHGHGQGLYLCRQIMAYLGGSIAYSDPFGRNIEANTAFRLEFSRRR